MNGRQVSAWFCLIALASAARPSPAASLHFDRPFYEVYVGERFEVSVFLDMDDAAPGDQTVAGGLFSAGTRLSFEPGRLAVPGTNDLVLPPELNSDGIEGPAVKSVGPGIAGAFGVIGRDSTNAYTGAVALTATLQALAPGSHLVVPGLYWSPPLANFFAAGQMVELDGLITNLVPSLVVAIAPPVITGIQRSGPDDVTIAFVGTNLPSAGFLMDGTSNPPPFQPWMEITNAAVRTNAPGSYEARAPCRGFWARFFRVRVRRK